MPRAYDSSRRLESARRTRAAIVAAAFRLHGEGILDLESLAREADVSVATIRKHFPNREQLFAGCTAYAQHQVPQPDLAALAGIEDRSERLREGVRQTYALYESLFGQIWLGYRLEDESPAMSVALRAVEGTAAEVADLVAAAWLDQAAVVRGLVAGMLSPLTYRGLRIHGGLTPGAAATSTVRILLAVPELGARQEEWEAADR